MEKRIVISVCILAGIGLYIYKSSSSAENANEQNENIQSATNNVQPSSSNTSAKAIQKSSDIMSDTISSANTLSPEAHNDFSEVLKVKLPNKEKIREQVKQNPHSAPAEHLNFSIELSDKMDIAMTNENAAKVLFNELEKCVADKDGYKASQALCIINAKRINEKYPSTDIKGLLKKANPNVLDQASLFK